MDVQMPRMYGLDLSLALRSAGKPTTLAKMLRAFARIYRDGEPRLLHKGAREPQTGLAEICHSLQGACGAIGAASLAADMRDLELRLQGPVSDLAATTSLGAQIHEDLRQLAARLAEALPGRIET